MRAGRPVSGSFPPKPGAEWITEPSAQDMAAIIVLTATITPPAGVPNLKRFDPALRRTDYLDAFQFYLRLPTSVVDRIVFVENSLDELSELRNLAANESDGKRVEFVSLDGLDYPPAYGRAYGEFKMLDHAVSTSALLNELNDVEYFWKITGRLKVLNLPHVIRKSASNRKMIIDFVRRPVPIVDLRLYACCMAGYRDLLKNQYPTLREDVLKGSAEGHLYSMWVGQTRKLGISPRHAVQPKIGGVGGQHNVDYFSGANVAKYWLRALVRRTLPGIWI